MSSLPASRGTTSQESSTESRSPESDSLLQTQTGDSKNAETQFLSPVPNPQLKFGVRLPEIVPLEEVATGFQYGTRPAFGAHGPAQPREKVISTTISAAQDTIQTRHRVSLPSIISATSACEDGKQGSGSKPTQFESLQPRPTDANEPAMPKGAGLSSFRRAAQRVDDERHRDQPSPTLNDCNDVQEDNLPFPSRTTFGSSAKPAAPVLPLGDLSFPVSRSSPQSGSLHHQRYAKRRLRAVEEPRATSFLRPKSRESNTSVRRHPHAYRAQKYSPGEADLYGHIEGFAEHQEKFLKSVWSSTSHREREVARLEETLVEQAAQARRHQQESNNKDDTIAQLSSNNESLRKRLGDVESEFDIFKTTSVQRWDQKCQEYKNYINDAIQEQQVLYLKTKNAMKQAMDIIRDEAQARKVSIENSLAVSETVRNEMSKNIAQVTSEAHAQNQALEVKVQEMTFALKERQTELTKEKDATNHLRKELVETKLQQADTLEILRTQTAQILDLVEKERDQARSVDRSSSEQIQKLNNLTEVLQDVKNRMEDRDTAIEQLRGVKSDEMKAAIEELQKSTPSHSHLHQMDESLRAEFASIHTLFENIREYAEEHQRASHFSRLYEDTLAKLEVGERAQHEANELNRELQHHRDLAENDKRELTLQLSAAQSNLCDRSSLLEKQEAENRELRSQVGSLKLQLSQSQEHESDRAKSLEKQETENASLGGKIDSLRQQLALSQEETSDRNKLLEMQDTENGSLRSQIASLEEQLGTVESEAFERLTSLQTLLDERNERILEMDKKMEVAQARLSFALESERNVAAVSDEEISMLLFDLNKATKAFTELQNDMLSAAKTIERLEASIDNRAGGTPPGQQIRMVLSKIDDLHSHLGATRSGQDQLASELEKWTIERSNFTKVENLVGSFHHNQEVILDLKHMLAEVSAQKETAEIVQDSQEVRPGECSTINGRPQCEQDSAQVTDMNTLEASRKPYTGKGKRVVLQEPIDAEERLTPSVQQEQQMRRQAKPMRSIIKVSRANSVGDLGKEETAHAEKTETNVPKATARLKSKLPNQSAYNRPVMGKPPLKVSGIPPMQADVSQSSARSFGKQLHHGEVPESHSTKRQRPMVEDSAVEALQSVKRTRSNSHVLDEVKSEDSGIVERDISYESKLSRFSERTRP